jgi:hypothetical protein
VEKGDGPKTEEISPASIGEFSFSIFLFSFLFILFKLPIPNLYFKFYISNIQHNSNVNIIITICNIILFIYFFSPSFSNSILNLKIMFELQIPKYQSQVSPE